MSDVSPTVTPMVTTVTSTSLPPTTSQPTPPATSSGSTSLPNNPSRGPPQTRHQAAVSQGARFKVYRPVTSQAVVQLLDVLDEVTEEFSMRKTQKRLAQWKKYGKLSKNVRSPPMTDEMLPARGVFYQ